MEKLIKIQSELKAPKGNFNSFGKYKYRSAEDILEAVKPLLLKYGVVVTLSDSIEAIGGRLFLIARATIIDTDSNLITVCGYAELSEHKGMSSEQATGTASSYARKYALNGLFLIDETEADADNENVKKAPNKELIEAENKLRACGTLSALQNVYMDLSIEMRKLTLKLKDELKTTLPA
jgi:hypothetical protein